MYLFVCLSVFLQHSSSGWPQIQQSFCLILLSECWDYRRDSVQTCVCGLGVPMVGTCDLKISLRRKLVPQPPGTALHLGHSLLTPGPPPSREGENEAPATWGGGCPPAARASSDSGVFMSSQNGCKSGTSLYLGPGHSLPYWPFASAKLPEVPGHWQCLGLGLGEPQAGVSSARG